MAEFDSSRNMGRSLFSPDIREGEIAQFHAEGFTLPAVGVVYEDGHVQEGVPLGGLGTGYISLNGDGTLGLTTVFNDFPGPRDLSAPFLGLAVGSRVVVLSTRPPDGISGVRHQRYWGHFPIADLEFDLDLPVRVGLRAFSPFIPGDAPNSNIPAAVFELRLVNEDSQSQNVRVAFSFPGPEPTGGRFDRSRLADDGGTGSQGIAVSHTRFGRRVGYSLAVMGDVGAVAARSAFSDARGWASLSGEVETHRRRVSTSPSPDDPGASLVASATLPPKGSATLRFVLAWYYPDYRSGSSRCHHMYGRRFSSIEDVALTAAKGASELLRRTLSWQQVVYGTEDLPLWLRDALVNGLYSLAKNSWWNYSPLPDDWWGQDGLFTHNESFTGCPVTETMVCRFHGHFPMLFLFPDLERTTLRAFAHYQLKSGEIPFCLGQPADFSSPTFRCQHPLNSSQFVQLVYRYCLRTGDEAFLREMYPAVRDAVGFLKSLDVDADGLVNEHSHALPGQSFPANQFYDQWPWYGTSAYVAGIWLATLRCGQEMARLIGDAAFEQDCRVWLDRGLAAFEAKLWNGRYYRLYNDTAKDRLSETSLANQLMAVWCSSVTGLGGLLPNERVQQALRSVEELNVAAAGASGVVNGVGPDGIPYHSLPGDNPRDFATQTFVGEGLCVAMTFMYQGRRETGEKIARTLYEAIAVRHRTPWDQYCLIASDDGRPIWGKDYYSNMVIWAVPMALAGQDIRAFVAQGGLVDRLLDKPASSGRTSREGRD